MSATLSLIVFSAFLLLIHCLSRIPSPECKPDLRFSNTLKGLAILMISYHHSGIYHSNALWFFYGSGWGFCGVSLFLFISGFGLMRSQSGHDSGVCSFLKKRWLALGPTIILCMIARFLLNPVMTISFNFPLDLLTLSGLKEWYLVALFSWYILFIFLIKTIRSSDIPFVFGMVALLIWALLDIFSSSSSIAELWIRFPFSFPLGVICGVYPDKIFPYFKRRLWLSTLLSISAVCLICHLQNQKNLVYPMLDLAILPLGICLVIWIYRLNFNSIFIQFLGKNSLPLYLIQVPLIKYGIFMTRWRDDILGLMATWAMIFMVSLMITQIRNIIDSRARLLTQRFKT